MNHARRISLSLVITFLCGALYVANAETLTPIHIGVPTNSATWFPLYVTWKKGIFRDLGLELLPVTMQARTALAALASKQIGFITQIGSPMTAISRGLPASLIMVLCERSHHVLVTKPEITSPAQLRGRSDSDQPARRHRSSRIAYDPGEVQDRSERSKNGQLSEYAKRRYRPQGRQC